VAGRLEVAGGVAVRRAVAAVRQAAVLAGTQVHPVIAAPGAFDALERLRALHGGDVEVFADLGHGRVLLAAGMPRSPCVPDRCLARIQGVPVPASSARMVSAVSRSAGRTTRWPAPRD